MSDTTTTQVAEPAVIQFHPSLDETRLRAELPIARVTLLEDRAQVRRVGTVSLKAGLNRVAVWNIAPVVQDVSLRAAIEGPAQASARVLDARVRRALRVGYQEKPEAVRGIEQRLTELRLGFEGKVPHGLLFRVSSIDGDAQAAYREQERFVNDLLSAMAPRDRMQVIGLTPRT